MILITLYYYYYLPVGGVTIMDIRYLINSLVTANLLNICDMYNFFNNNLLEN